MGKRAGPSQTLIRHPSHILAARSRQHHWQGTGLLSIKTFRGGRAFYQAGGGYFAVDENHYLVLNHGEEYSITIDSQTPVESLCVFFQEGFADAVHTSLATSDESLLDHQEERPVAPTLFFQRTYPDDNLVAPLLRRVRSAPHDLHAEPLWLHEQLHALMVRLLQVRYNVLRDVERVPGAKAATREELYRRAHLARDYAEALFDHQVTLDDLARIAALSPNHLLRTFRSVFHQTPHQFIMQKRVERARQILVDTDMSITELCFALGMQSAGSFSSTFRRRTGMSPEAYRRRFR